MEAPKFYTNPNQGLLLQNEGLSCSSPILNSLWVDSTSSTFHGASSMVCFEGVRRNDATAAPFYQSQIKEENGGDEDSDECLQLPGKKRRLTAAQVMHLESSFEADNRLEPERKLQLAADLGLLPRQVAIWFQNRRARFKTKQLEKEYGTLKARFDRLKTDHGSLQKENLELASELKVLKEKLQARERKKMGDEKQIAKSEALESDHSSSAFEPADSYHVFEPDRSDFSHDDEEEEQEHEEDDPRLEFGFSSCHGQDAAANPCNFGFAGVDDQPFYFCPF